MLTEAHIIFTMFLVFILIYGVIPFIFEMLDFLEERHTKDVSNVNDINICSTESQGDQNLISLMKKYDEIDRKEYKRRNMVKNGVNGK